MRLPLYAVAFSLAFGAATSAQAANILIIGNNSRDAMAAFLTSNGNTVKTANTASAADYTGIDTAILLRTDGDSRLVSFVSGGGKLITEWSGAAWAVNAGNLLAADVATSGYIATNTKVTYTAAGLAAGLGAGGVDGYAAEGASEFFHTFSNIGSDVKVLATRNDGIAVTLGGTYGKGTVIANGSDWADSFTTQGGPAGQALLASVSANVAAVPEPATWAMMLVGFGMVAGASRYRRRGAKIAYA